MEMIENRCTEGRLNRRSLAPRLPPRREPFYSQKYLSFRGKLIVNELSIAPLGTRLHCADDSTADDLFIDPRPLRSLSLSLAPQIFSLQCKMQAYEKKNCLEYLLGRCTKYTLIYNIRITTYLYLLRVQA